MSKTLQIFNNKVRHTPAPFHKNEKGCAERERCHPFSFSLHYLALLYKDFVSACGGKDYADLRLGGAKSGRVQ